jgi:hypothetical protein
MEFPFRMRMENRGAFVGVKAGESYWGLVSLPNKILELVLGKSA